jgi:hypothetical protein
MHISNKELFTGIMGEKNVRWHDDGKMDNIEIPCYREMKRPDPAIPIPITRIGIQKQVYTILTPDDSFLCMRR